MGMKKKREKTLRRKTASRRLNQKRLNILLASAAAVVVLAGFGGYKTYEYFHEKSRIRKPVVLEDGQELPFVDLQNLREEVTDVFTMKNLGHLKTDIQTFLFNNQLNDLKDQINSYLKENNVDTSKIAWAVQDLSTNAYTESDNAHQNFIAASTYKLPLCMLWYEKVQDGTASMSDTFELTEKMLEKEDTENPDQPIGRKYRLGDRIPLSELLEGTALYSDNIAGHILFENLGGYVNYKVQALKYTDTLQDKDFTSGKNVLNPHYTMNLVNYMFNHPGTFDDLKFWLYAALTDNFLNKAAPLGYIQKIGNNEEVRNAIGLMPGAFPYSVSVYSAIDEKEGEKIIGDIGLICYNYFSDKYNSGFYDESLLEGNLQKSHMNVQTASLAEYASSDYTGGSVYDPFQKDLKKKDQDQDQNQNQDANAQNPAPADPNQPADPNAAQTNPDQQNPEANPEQTPAENPEQPADNPDPNAQVQEAENPA